MDDRIIDEQFTNKFKISEIDEIKNFSKLIKEKFKNLDFKILYLSNKLNDAYDSENKIITINSSKYKPEEYNWNNCNKIFYNILEDKEHFLKSIFNLEKPKIEIPNKNNKIFLTNKLLLLNKKN
jgi:hypothetical protein